MTLDELRMRFGNDNVICSENMYVDCTWGGYYDFIVIFDGDKIIAQYTICAYNEDSGTVWYSEDCDGVGELEASDIWTREDVRKYH